MQITNEFQAYDTFYLEYDTIKDKYYLTFTKAKLETFYGDYAVKERLYELGLTSEQIDNLFNECLEDNYEKFK